MDCSLREQSTVNANMTPHRAIFLILLVGVPSVAGEPPALYDGRTLTEWRERIKSLNLDSPASATAVPGLLAIVRDDNVPWFTRRQAAMTLGRMGKTARDAVPVLVGLLGEADDSDESPRIWAAKALALFGREAAAAAPTAVANLRDESVPLEQRQVMLELLANIGTRHPAAVPALIETLNLSPSPGTPANAVSTLRMLAAEALSVVGFEAVAAVPALARATLDPQEIIRRRAVEALGSIGPGAVAALPVLIESLAFDESPAVRDSAGVALSQLGIPAVEPLTRILTDEAAELRLRAADSLGRMGRIAAGAAPALRELLGDADPAVRLQAAESLWQIAGNADVVTPVFVEFLKDRDRQRRITAVRRLIEIGSKQPQIVGIVQPLLNDMRPFVRQAAEKILEDLR